MSTKIIFAKIKQRKANLHPQSSEIKCEQPIIPMSKVCLDVIKKLQTEPYPQLTLATHSTISEALELYFNEYVRLFKQNQILNDQLASILLERNSFADQFNQIKKMKSYDDNIRRRRRYASQIERNYHCPMPKCNKGYGSEGSLTHHVRLKHAKFFQSGEYQIYLETYILPKQEIKNQEARAAIDLEQMLYFQGKRQERQKKIQIIDDQIKQVRQAKQLKQAKELKLAKQQQNSQKIKMEQKAARKVPNENPTKSKKTCSLGGQPNRLMNEVDGYLELQQQNEEDLKSKLNAQVLQEQGDKTQYQVQRTQ